MVLVSYACYAAVVVGHWPRFANPDPGELPSRILRDVMMYLSLLGVLSVVVTPFGYGIFRAIAARKGSILASQAIVIIVFSVGAVAWVIDVILMYTEGPSLLSWILD